MINTATDWYCLGCRYSLHGLPEPRCPECGREFDPDDPRSFKRAGEARGWAALKRRLRPVGRFLQSPAGVVLGIWLLAPVGVGILSLAATTIATGVYLTQRRWLASGAVLCINPFAVAFMHGVNNYWNGDVRDCFQGLPRAESNIVDPVYRWQRASKGCTVSEDCFDTVYMMGAHVMFDCFGVSPRAYLGPYPTKEETLAALEGGGAISASDILARTIRVGDTDFRINSAVDLRQLLGVGWFMAGSDAEAESWLRSECGPIRATRLQCGCPTIWVPGEAEGSWRDPNTPPAALIVVIDPNTGWPFAYYTVGQLSWEPHFLPRWKNTPLPPPAVTPATSPATQP